MLDAIDRLNWWNRQMDQLWNGARAARPVRAFPW